MNINHSERVSGKGESVAVLAVGWILLDSMITYYSNNFFGFLAPVSLLLPFIILYISMRWGAEGFKLPNSVSLALFISLTAFLCGHILNNEYTITKLGAPILAMCVFLIGFYAFRWCSNENRIIWLFIIVSLMYGVVCVLALQRFNPALFPMIEYYWSNEGQLVLRPEITTDQNFQYFYLFPATALLLLPYKLVRTSLILLATLLSAYVLVSLQTRSGIMTFVGLVSLVMLAPLFYRELGRGKIVMLPVLFVIFAIVYHEAIINILSNLLARLSDAGAQQTGLKRLASTLYIFRQLMDPVAWFIPQGNREFLNEYGVKPHSNISAMFAEGGIWGLYMWLIAFVVPIYSLSVLFLKRRLDALAIVILCSGISMLILQSTLNVPFFKQPWLWAGAVLGTLVRVRSANHDQHNRLPDTIIADEKPPRVFLKRRAP